MAKKNGAVAVAAEVAVGAEQEVQSDPIVALIGDQGAKKMGPAKDGGSWYRSQSGKLYRIQEVNGEHKVVETKERAVPATNKKAKKADGGFSRQEMMEVARSKKMKYFRVMNKKELAEVTAVGCSVGRLSEIQTAAVKRWKKV